ncbi:hypothetical protein ColLi_03471 [Colletotrichum liriopes]|uniref:Uncharacterized protein n=1 Tax=Colletotrichum liriopes TaxID=708192 RepID=A0AA37GHY9_9PEZI|nr:hypothetical protein ColLi_03471 [Colletotrichum liriopes]
MERAAVSGAWEAQNTIDGGIERERKEKASIVVAFVANETQPPTLDLNKDVSVSDGQIPGRRLVEATWQGPNGMHRPRTI